MIDRHDFRDDFKRASSNSLSTESNFTRSCTSFQLHELLENENLASPESLYLEAEMRGGGLHCEVIDDRGLGWGKERQ